VYVYEYGCGGPAAVGAGVTVGLHVIKRGLDIPVDGAPAQVIEDAATPGRVGLLADDTPGLRPRLCVREGDRVVRGQLLYEDGGAPGVRYTTPASGTVQAIHRGARRALQSVVIRLDEHELAGGEHAAHLGFAAFSGRGEAETTAGVRALLVESGLWTALRVRPFGGVPAVDATPRALLVTAVDTQPLAARPEVVIDERSEDFERGLRLLAKLCPGRTYLCVGAASPIPRLVDAPVAVEEFAGPHPAGSPGVHVHLLAPVDRRRSAWTIGYQDVIAAGRLFADGRLAVERVVALGGPAVRRPRLLRTRLGAALDDLTSAELAQDGVRVISGSVLSGKRAMGPVFGYLGRGDVQVSVLRESARTEIPAWQQLAALFGAPRAAVDTTACNGRRAPVVPSGVYERVLPMDLLATLLLRALMAGDDEQAERLGCLELLEEDLALCSFVCPGKNDYGPALRAALQRIAEGI